MSEWGKNLLTRMIVVNENDRIGWDDLFDMVRWYNPHQTPRSSFDLIQKLVEAGRGLKQPGVRPRYKTNHRRKLPRRKKNYASQPQS